MTYETPQALRMALEQRLLNQSRETDISLDRLRRRVVFERIVARLVHAEPGRWVLKGGMALEVRLRDHARLTKDIDLGLRDTIAEHAELQERLVDALAVDPFDDRFVLAAGPVTELRPDGSGHVTWRSNVATKLAGRPFGRIQLDVSPRAQPTPSPFPTRSRSPASRRPPLRSSTSTATPPRSSTPSCENSATARTRECATSSM